MDEKDKKRRTDWVCALERAGESDKSWGLAFFLSFFLGMLGADRFYLGYGLLGILKLLTAGGCGVWWIVDLIALVMGKMRDADDYELRPPWKQDKS